MDKINEFLVIIAWIGAVIGSLQLIIGILAQTSYSEWDKLMDSTQGIERSWIHHIKRGFVIATICITYLIVFK